jgi:hypothetical protein
MVAIVIKGWLGFRHAAGKQGDRKVSSKKQYIE